MASLAVIAILGTLTLVCVLGATWSATRLRGYPDLQRYRAFMTSQGPVLARAHRLTQDVADLVRAAIRHDVDVQLVGSLRTGTFVDPDVSDVDVQVTLSHCVDFAPAAAALERGGFARVYSGPAYSLFRCVTRNVDVSLSVVGARASVAPPSTPPSPKELARRFLVYMARKAASDVGVNVSVRRR